MEFFKHSLGLLTLKVAIGTLDKSEVWPNELVCKPYFEINMKTYHNFVYRLNKGLGLEMSRQKVPRFVIRLTPKSTCFHSD